MTTSAESWETSGEAFILRLEELAWDEAWEEMRSLLDRLHNEDETERNPCMFTVLLEIIFQSLHPPLDLVERIFGITGKAAFTQPSCVTGRFPLHALLSSSAEVEIVTYLGRVAPEVAHLPCPRGLRPMDVLTERLWQQQEQADRCCLGRGPSDRSDYYLSSQARRQDGHALWSCAYQLVRMMLNVTTTSSSKDYDDDMVHLCLRARHVLPTRFLQLVLSKFRDQLSEPVDADGNYPLHLVVSSASSNDNDDTIARLVLEGYPHAASLPNRAGQLPLQLLAARRRQGGMVRQLVRQAPQALFQGRRRSDARDAFFLTQLCPQHEPAIVYCLLHSNPNLLLQRQTCLLETSKK